MNHVAFPATIALDTGVIDAVRLALFAAASGDHNPLHLDADVARAAGFDRPVVHGMFSLACAARLFARHFGAGSVVDLQARFTGVALRGDRLRLHATLEGVDDGIARYTVEARSDRDTEVLLGSARVKRREVKS